MFKIVQLKFQNLQLSFQNFTTPIAKFTTQIAKFTTECSKFCLGGGAAPPHTPPSSRPWVLRLANDLQYEFMTKCTLTKILNVTSTFFEKLNTF